MAVVIKRFMIWGSKWQIGYVKYDEAEVDKLLAILKTNNCGGGSGGGGPCVIQ